MSNENSFENEKKSEHLMSFNIKQQKLEKWY